MTNNDDTLSLVQRAEILTQAYAAVQLYFAHWQALPADFDFDVVYRQALERGLASDDREQFDFVMMELVASLQNGHSFYWDTWLDGRHPPLGFRPIFLDGQWVVGQSWIEGLPIGAVIETINGEATEALYQAHRCYFAGSDERARRNAFHRIRYFLPAELTLKLGDGRTVNIDRQAVTEPAKELRTAQLADGQVGYMHIPNFMESRFEQGALAAVREFAGCEALIIDLRWCPGGSTPGQLIEALMDRPYRWWTESTRATFGIHRASGAILKRYRDQMDERSLAYFDAMGSLGNAYLMWPSPPEPPKEPIFTGKVVIVVNSITGSAAEDFVYPFKDNGRAVLIGEHTAGSTGQPSMYDVGNGITFGVGSKRSFMATGAAFEGIGLAPDIEVPTTAADMQAGRDPVLEKALAVAIGG